MGELTYEENLQLDREFYNKIEAPFWNELRAMGLFSEVELGLLFSFDQSQSALYLRVPKDFRWRVDAMYVMYRDRLRRWGLDSSERIHT